MGAPSTVYSPALLKAPRLRPLAELATTWLEEAISPSLDPVSVEWDAPDAADGRNLLALRLRDFAGVASAVFDPEEFVRPTRVRSRLRGTYQVLLGHRAAVLLAGLQSGPAVAGGGDAGTD